MPELAQRPGKLLEGGRVAVEKICGLVDLVQTEQLQARPRAAATGERGERNDLRALLHHHHREGASRSMRGRRGNRP